MLESLVRLLTRDFDIVAAVSDGTAAVAEAEQLEPDLLVLDIAMPGLNGIAAAARLKEQGSQAKVVFVTNMRVAWAHVDQPGMALFEEAHACGVRAAETIAASMGIAIGESWL